MDRKFFLASLFLVAAVSAWGAKPAFFSTEKSDNLFDIGVHLGINTSNRTMAKAVFDEWNVNSWGTGFDIGATVDVNFRDWLSIQPGFFFESRSGNFAYCSSIPESGGSKSYFTQLGHGRSYNFTIPVLAAAHFNLTGDVRLNAECGPYLQFGLNNTFNNKSNYPLSVLADGAAVAPEGWGTAKTRSFDFGFRFGTGITVMRHYNFAVHYCAGWLNVWNPSELGGRNKAWTFTLGYLF